MEGPEEAPSSLNSPGQPDRLGSMASLLERGTAGHVQLGARAEPVTRVLPQGCSEETAPTQAIFFLCLPPKGMMARLPGIIDEKENLY